MSLLTLVLKGICSLVPRIFIIHEYTRKLALYRIWYKFWHGETHSYRNHTQKTNLRRKKGRAANSISGRRRQYILHISSASFPVKERKFHSDWILSVWPHLWHSAPISS